MLRAANHCEPHGANYAANSTRSRTALPGRRNETQLEWGLQKRQHLSQSASQVSQPGKSASPAKPSQAKQPRQRAAKATVRRPSQSLSQLPSLSVPLLLPLPLIVAAYDVDCSGSSDNIVGGSARLLVRRSRCRHEQRCRRQRRCYTKQKSRN